MKKKAIFICALAAAAAMSASSCTDLADISELVDSGTETTASSAESDTDAQDDEKSAEYEQYLKENEAAGNDGFVEKGANNGDEAPSDDNSEIYIDPLDSPIVDIDSPDSPTATDSRVLSFEDNRSEAPDRSAYRELIGKYSEKCAEDPTLKSELCRYYITDINDDGTPELLIETGSIEADRTVSVYSMNRGKAEKIGEFYSWHSELGEGDGVIYSETSAFGSYVMSTIRIENGLLVTEQSDEPTDESKIQHHLKSYPFDDLSGLE